VTAKSRPQQQRIIVTTEVFKDERASRHKLFRLCF
jgi:hypothetical protein